MTNQTKTRQLEQKLSQIKADNNVLESILNIAQKQKNESAGRQDQAFAENVLDNLSQL